jgi:dTDP-glucose pyrophosphorylase
MLPVNGKPVIAWILNDLLQKNIVDVIIVSKPEDQRLRDFIQWAYAQRMKIQFVSPHGQTILHSLQAGLRLCQLHQGIRIILGDTLIRDKFDDHTDFVYTGIVEDTRRWCLVTISPDAVVQDYLEKPAHSIAAPLALAGYYYLTNAEYFRHLLEGCLKNDGRELSDVLRPYGQKYPIRAGLAGEWYDFGHIDNLVEARIRLLQPRFFNALAVNPVLNTITKTSQDNDKLQNELDWYLSLPKPLQVLAPRIISHQNVDGQVQIVQEYYGYPTLAESYVYGDFDIELWESILRKIMRVHREFRNYSGQITSAQIQEMYLGKTEERLATLTQTSPYWQNILAQPFIEYNGRILKNICVLLPALSKRIQEISTSASIYIIHGDFCFSNILFDINSQIIRLIDPRGYFGRKGIYGDPRYDIAKLRHSISGLYDFILADLFTIEEISPGVVIGRVFANETQNTLAQYFDALLAADGYSLNEIRLIEGLLFISMLPYHQDHPTRQKMFYLTGLSLLNEVLQ